MLKKVLVAIFLALFVAPFFLVFLVGCRAVTYTAPDGRSVQVVSLLNNAKVGHFEVTTPEGGKLVIDDLSTEERLTELAKLLAATKAVP